MSNDLVTVATFSSLSESAAAREALESWQIRTQADEATIAWSWRYSDAVDGVELQVPRDDLARAREFLMEAQAHIANEEKNLLIPWTCQHCANHVDADMDFCWYCGTARDSLERSDIFDVDHPGVIAVDEPLRQSGGALPAWLAFLMIVFPPLLVGYAILSIMFPRGSDDEQDPSRSGVLPDRSF